MKLSRDKIERLIFVKYLFSQARIQKNIERPMSSAAILTIHDCIESFLQLCFEVKTGRAKINSNNILDTYSEEINKILKEEDKSLINKAYIKRINDLRNQLKHSTIFTDPKQIPNLFTETEIFLNDFTSLIFSFSFESISLVELIPNENIKNYLKSAQVYIESKDNQKAIWSIGKAFYELEKTLTKVEGKLGENILNSHHEIDYLIKYRVSFGGDEPSNMLRNNLKEIAADINRLQDEIQTLKSVLSMSVDLKEYIKFKQYMPYVSKIVSSGETKFWIPDEERNNKIDYKIDIVNYCFDFVIELAINEG